MVTQLANGLKGCGIETWLGLLKTTSVKSCMLDSIVDEKYERSLRSFLVLYLCIIITLFNTYGSSEYSLTKIQIFFCVLILNIC